MMHHATLLALITFFMQFYIQQTVGKKGFDVEIAAF